MPDVARRQWICPQCRQSWDIPAGAANPESCPKCPPAFRVEYQAMPAPVREFNPPSMHSSLARRLIAVLLLTAGVAAVAAFLAMPRRMPPVAGDQAPAPPAKNDPEFAMIDRYLRETLDDGNYEVVKWWPAVPRKAVEDIHIAQDEAGIQKGGMLIQENQQAIDVLKKKGVKEPPGDRFTPPPLYASDDQKKWATHRNRIADLRDQIAELEKDIAMRRNCSTDSVCRLRYRFFNKFGAKTLADTIFIIRGDLVIPIPEGEDRYAWLRADLETLFGTTPKNQPVDPAEVFDAVIDQLNQRD